MFNSDICGWCGASNQEVCIIHIYMSIYVNMLYIYLYKNLYSISGQITIIPTPECFGHFEGGDGFPDPIHTTWGAWPTGVEWLRWNLHSIFDVYKLLQVPLTSLGSLYSLPSPNTPFRHPNSCWNDIWTPPKISKNMPKTSLNTFWRGI